MRAYPVFLTALVLTVGCAGGATKEASTSSPSASRPAPTLTVTRDVTYATVDDADWIPAQVDVYAPKGAHALPLVVMFHGVPNTKTSFLPPVAEAVAREGAVVVVANWGNPMPLPPAASTVVGGKRVASEAACAVSFAVAHAGEYGADPSRLVLFGHSGGANTAAMVAYGKPTAFPGCRVAPSVSTPRGVMLWEGDWLLESPDPWDKFGPAVGTVMPALTPWQLLAIAPKIPAELAVTAMSRIGLDRCDVKGSDWLTWRDPTGAFRRGLTAAGALKDDCVNVGEAADLLAATMNTHGIPATVLALPDPGSIHEILAPADLTRIAQHTVEMAGA
jgi:pimeloyl-ACP methyl ester carboxylesterase